MDEALAAAYLNNSTLNADRAQQRATDENVPQALSALRPSVAGVADAGRKLLGLDQGFSYDAGVNVSQTLFSGFRNINAVKQAQSTVQEGQQTLRQSEATTLLDAVTVFMDLVQAQAVLNLRSQATTFYRSQIQSTQALLDTGQATRVDVSEANARLSAAQSDFYRATADLTTAIARYGQIVGHAPQTLGTARSIEALLPTTVDAAIVLGLAQHPAIQAASFAADAAQLAVNVAQGALLPTISLNGSVGYSNTPAFGVDSPTSVTARLTVPFSSGGAGASKVRAAKEVFDQRRLELDAAKEEVRTGIVSSWALLDAARKAVVSANSQVTEQQALLSGITEQRQVGEATTLDVLNAEQDLLTSQVAQVMAQHDRVVNEYALLAAVGGLDAAALNLNVPIYDPAQHYTQVRDKLGGTRTPDGR